MSYIFIDESGDLGFDFSREKTSKYFIVTCLFVKEKWPIEKIIKKIFQNLAKSKIKRHDGVFHCYKESPSIRTKLFKLISTKEISVMCIYLEKKKVYTYLYEKKHQLYNYVLNQILDRIFSKKLLPWNHFTIVASRRETNKALNENFEQYLYRQHFLTVEHRANTEIKLEIRTPTEEKCLQIVDALSWGIFRKYEHNDNSYYNIFKDIIIEENPMFP